MPANWVYNTISDSAFNSVINFSLSQIFVIQKIHRKNSTIDQYGQNCMITTFRSNFMEAPL